jgi:hypothetical protein
LPSAGGYRRVERAAIPGAASSQRRPGTWSRSLTPKAPSPGTGRGQTSADGVGGYARANHPNERHLSHPKPFRRLAQPPGFGYGAEVGCVFYHPVFSAAAAPAIPCPIALVPLSRKTIASSASCWSMRGGRSSGALGWVLLQDRLVLLPQRIWHAPAGGQRHFFGCVFGHRRCLLFGDHRR